ncbi:hypothetical protein [Lacticaseibacillus sp. N501-2]|uniref:hypothetical protein n=1 Tax=Lacticaseibacillus salsurae TaxID=3367729 RepID=UPI0038B34E5C
MGIFGDSRKGVEALVQSLGYDLDGNFILAYHRMNNVAKVAVNILFRVPSMGTSAVEKQYLVIFSPERLVLHQMSKNGETRVLQAQDIEDFHYRDGANHSLVFEFRYHDEAFSFYTYQDFSFKLKYIGDNVAQLVASDFLGYAKA